MWRGICCNQTQQGSPASSIPLSHSPVGSFPKDSATLSWPVHCTLPPSPARSIQQPRRRGQPSTLGRASPCTPSCFCTSIFPYAKADVQAAPPRKDPTPDLATENLWALFATFFKPRLSCPTPRKNTTPFLHCSSADGQVECPVSRPDLALKVDSIPPRFFQCCHIINLASNLPLFCGKANRSLPRPRAVTILSHDRDTSKNGTPGKNC